MAVNFRRKDIRLAADAYKGRRLYFLTLCFHKRKPFASNPRTARWLIGKLREHAPKTGFAVHAYCVMPDHVHILALGMGEASDLRVFVGEFKQRTGFVFTSKTSRELWQLKYYDHIVRTEDAARSVAAYIWMNPVRKGLCAKPQDYAFSGSFTELGTQMLRASGGPEPWTPPWKKAGGDKESLRKGAI
jgi:REP-associated tyrosine transposase